VFSYIVGFGTGHFYMKDDAAGRFLIRDAANSALAAEGLIYSGVASPTLRLYDVFAAIAGTDAPRDL
jgi:hypothetical protein